MDVTKRQEDFNLVVMNFSGRFNNVENRVIGQHVATQVLVEKNAAVLFGQQSNFVPTFPYHYKCIGQKRAFFAYDTNKFKCLDDTLYQVTVKELQDRKKIPLHYLSDNNYAAIKLRSRFLPRVKFIALSWITNESMGQTKSLSIFKILMGFIKNISDLEKLPLIVGGSFRLTPDVAAEHIPSGFKCYSYVPETPRRAARAASFFVCSECFLMEGIRPLSCGNIQPPKAAHRGVNPEDALYCDPVLASIVQPESYHQEPEEIHINNLFLSLNDTSSIVETPRLSVKHKIMANGVSNGNTANKSIKPIINGHTNEPTELKVRQFKEISLLSKLSRAQNHSTVPVEPYRDQSQTVNQNNDMTHRKAETTFSKDEVSTIEANPKCPTSYKKDTIFNPVLGNSITKSASYNGISMHSGRPEKEVPLAINHSRATSWSGSLYDEEEIDTNTRCYMS